MWHTSHGDRTLQGLEAALFLESVGYLRDMLTVGVDLDEPHVSGVALFDALQPTQQLAALHCVATALLEPEVESPALCAVLEATVYVVYRELLSLIEIEIEAQSRGPIGIGIRQGVLLVRQQPLPPVPGQWEVPSPASLTLPAVDCQQIDLWEAEVEQLANLVLWDRDFELESILADQDPSQAATIKRYLGIGANYFSLPAPDAMSGEFSRLDRELVALKSRAQTLWALSTAAGNRLSAGTHGAGRSA